MSDVLRGRSTLEPPPAPPVDDDGGHGGCPWAPRHLPVVVYTRRLCDRFRVRYWLRCWTCDLCEGPFEAWPMANAEREWIEER